MAKSNKRRATRPQRGIADCYLVPLLLLLVVGGSAAWFAWSRVYGMSDEDGKFFGTLKNGLPEGRGTMKWRTGKFYVGDWREGKMSGDGRLSFPDGECDPLDCLRSLRTWLSPPLPGRRRCLPGRAARWAPHRSWQLSFWQRQQV